MERWTAATALADQFVSAMSVAELERGVAARERTDPQQGALLRKWFEERVLPAFEGRVLPFDLAAARVLGGYRVPEHAPLDDALIAAVAEANDMVVATRNAKHFESLGVRCVNPWKTR